MTELSSAIYYCIGRNVLFGILSIVFFLYWNANY